MLALVARWDLLGDFVDPSMPPASRFVAGAVGLAALDRRRRRDDDARSRGHRSARSSTGAASAVASLARGLAALPPTPRLATRGATARHARPGSPRRRGVERRARCASRPPAPPGAARSRRAVTSALRARRGAATGLPAHPPLPPVLRPRAGPAPPSCARGPRPSPTSRSTRWSRSSSSPSTASSPPRSATLDAQVYDRTEVVVVAPGELRCDPAVVVVTASGTFEELANAGVEAANGEFTLVCGAGDLFASHALCDLVTALQDGADAAYADEDRYDLDHEHQDGHLKPARFGRETLFSYDVIGAPLVVRTTALQGARGARRHDRAPSPPTTSRCAWPSAPSRSPTSPRCCSAVRRTSPRTPSTRRPPRSPS